MRKPKEKPVHKHFWSLMDKSPIVIHRGGMTYCITGSVRDASEITGVSTREIESQLAKNTRNAWYMSGVYTKDRDGQDAYFKFYYFDQSDEILYNTGGSVEGNEDMVYACVQQVVSFFGQIASIKDHYIADNKLIIIFDHELLVDDVDAMQRILANSKECHSVMNDHLDLGYTKDQNSVRIGLKVPAKPTFKTGGQTQSKFDDGGTIPKQLDSFPNEIEYWNGVYTKALITPDFTFYANFDEGDENANTLMYRNDGSLVSDNYFANVGMNDELMDEDQNYIFIHKNIYDYLDEIRNN